MDELKSGTIVQLVSGGPDMTVSMKPLGSQMIGEMYVCQWFDKEDKYHAETFTRASLKIIKEP